MKANIIINAALDICGMRNSDGTVPSSCNDIDHRAAALLGMTAAEYVGIDKVARNSHADVPDEISPESEIMLSDGICRTVIPYLLAALLIEDEDQTFAATLRRLANDALTAFRHDKARTHEIKEVY